MDGKNIGNAILEYRKKHNITQSELGEKLNVSDKTISRWERGDRIPDSYAIKEISKLLNISCDELLGIKRHEKSKKMYKKFLNKIKKNNMDKFPIYLLILILCIIIFLLSFGLCNNLNNFKVYNLSSENDEIIVNGQIILTPTKNLLTINEVKKIDDSDFDNLKLYDYQYELLVNNQKIYQNGNISGYIYDEYSELITIDEILKNINIYTEDIYNFDEKNDVSILITYLDEDRLPKSVTITLKIKKIISNNKLHYK